LANNKNAGTASGLSLIAINGTAPQIVNKNPNISDFLSPMIIYKWYENTINTISHDDATIEFKNILPGMYFNVKLSKK
jgi:hypothetical protein